jgi:uncharacterized membrane protein
MSMTSTDGRAAAVSRVATATTPAARLVSLDVMRGLVMVVMAIDHVRVYSGLPAGGPAPAIFFTRWVTHFCAPAFVFFAGTSAFLSGRQRTSSDLRWYLVTRGAWLVLLELTVIRLAWTFNFDYASYILAGVIWMLGVCMILLAGLVRLPTPAIATFALLLIFGQDGVGMLLQAMPGSSGWIGRFLYFGGVVHLGRNGPPIAVLYSIVPWIGVMAAGYAFGAIVLRETAERRRLCLWIGLSATALFVLFGGIAVFSSPAPPGAPPAFFRLLNQRKYPASQLFLLMTLGPTIAVLPFAERARGVVGEALAVFGRVPLFYYLLHIPVIHAAALAVSLVREGRLDPWLFGNHPMMPPPVPDGYTWGLPLLYLVFVVVVAILYVPCRSFGRAKAHRHDGWLRYL